MKRSLQFLPEAEAEMWEATAFYESRREGLGVAFVSSIERTIHEFSIRPTSALLAAMTLDFGNVWFVDFRTG